MKNPRLYQTPFTKSINIVLKKTPLNNAYRVWCTAFDATTMQRVYEFDKYYLNKDLQALEKEVTNEN